ncbi:MAG: prepilin-type N-terminal cleavage/methylation domain-containing protein [Lachnospiraceae bacterium]|nr:prepilin-type N-terminal cleavage/methylation domain-containing protein [Lachnospiraceae bacterium]
MMKVRSVRQLNSSSVRSNGGFSLLELIISIAILAIIIGPLMSAFVVSSQSVSKSKRLADQNAAAQNVYEKIQAEPGDYFYRWVRGNDKKNTKVDEVSAEDKEKGYNDLLKYFGTSADPSMVPTTTLLQNSWDGTNKKDNHGDVVYLSLPNIYQNGALKYSAAVTLQAGTGNKPTGTETTADLGQILSDMNEKPRTQPMVFDNIFVQPTDASIDPDKLAEAAVTSRGGMIVSKKRTIYVHFTTSVSISKDGAMGTTDTTTYVQPVVCYCYDITYTSADGKRVRLYSVPDYNSSDNSITGFNTYEDVDGIRIRRDDVSVGYIDSSFSRIKYKYTDTNGKVKTDPINFYLCFQPYYGSKSNIKDNIVIDNIERLKGDVYLVKQNGDDSEPYSGVVRLVENHPDNKTKFDFNIHTNMGLKKDMETPIASGKIDFRKFYDVDNKKLGDFYGARSASDPDIWYVDGSRDVSFRNLINKNAEEHIYSVTIRIYDSLQLRTGTTYNWKNGYYYDSSVAIEPRYTLTGIKRG